MVDLIISDEHEKIEPEMIDTIRNVIENALKYEGIDFATEISLSFVTDDEIRVLNKDFRNIDKKTDVLSFPMYEREDISRVDLIKEEHNIALGDIVVSFEACERQAEEYGHSYKRELCYLIVHSVLHLLGYDHMEEGEKEAMRLKEERILEHMGITR